MLIKVIDFLISALLWVFTAVMIAVFFLMLYQKIQLSYGLFYLYALFSLYGLFKLRQEVRQVSGSPISTVWLAQGAFVGLCCLGLLAVGLVGVFELSFTVTQAFVLPLLLLVLLFIRRNLADSFLVGESRSSPIGKLVITLSYILFIVAVIVLAVAFASYYAMNGWQGMVRSVTPFTPLNWGYIFMLLLPPYLLRLLGRHI